MQLVRTTIRIPKQIKKAAERKAVEEDTTLQQIFYRALNQYLNKEARKEAKKKIKFLTHDFGEPFDNLTRDDFYDDPKL